MGLLLFANLVASGAINPSQKIQASPFADSNSLVWCMVNVNTDERQGDAHVLRFPDGRFFLIDTGDQRPLLQQFLTAHGIRTLDKVIVSHWHKDHYGSLRAMISQGIKVEEVIANPPDKGVCNYEKGWGCDFEDVQNVYGFLSARRVSVRTAKNGDVLQQSPDGIRLDVVYVHDGVTSPIGKTDLNDTSILLRLTHPKVSILFTGDLNDKLGSFLAKSDLNLKADILKIPHHGTESAAPDAFFDKVGAKVAFVPSPAGLWNSPRSKRMKDYFESRNIPTYVNGIAGTVCLTVNSMGYQIKNY